MKSRTEGDPLVEGQGFGTLVRGDAGYEKNLVRGERGPGGGADGVDDFFAAHLEGGTHDTFERLPGS